jgi:hypothetical protein
MATQRVISLPLGRDDLMLLKEAVETELSTGLKTGQSVRRARLYGLKRRLHRAILDLER